MKEFEVRFTSIHLGNRANFKINYKGKLYSGCAKRHYIFECAENSQPIDITNTKLGAEMLIAAHHALRDTQEYKEWIQRIEAN